MSRHAASAVAADERSLIREVCHEDIHGFQGPARGLLSSPSVARSVCFAGKSGFSRSDGDRIRDRRAVASYGASPASSTLDA